MTEDWEPGLAATKLHPPAPPRRYVRRTRLDERLDAGVDEHVPLLLVSAPAGSGKSTLLASWLAGRPEETAWLQATRSRSCTSPSSSWSTAPRRAHSSRHPTRSMPPSRSALASHHGVAPAYAVRARTADDTALARADAAHALASARQASTQLALGYVLAVCGDALLDLGEDGRPLLVEARTVLARCADPGIAGSYLARTESRHGVRTNRDQPVATLVEQLTDRELAVVRYLPTKLTQRNIASELYVSLNTVKTHCRAIYRKLGVGGRAAAVQAARDLQLL